jgi:hypothetical protein
VRGGEVLWEGRDALLLLLPIADALRSCIWRGKYCGYFQCDERCVDHCCPQRHSMLSCSHIAAERRTRDIRWRRSHQYCGHLQCNERCMDHCCPQRRSTISCGHIAAERRTRDIRWRPRCVVFFMSVIAEGGVRGGLCWMGEVWLLPLLLIANASHR